MANPRVDARRHISPNFNRFIDRFCILIHSKGPSYITEKAYFLPVWVMVSLVSHAQHGPIAN